MHGAPLGENEIKLTRTNLNWEYPPFSYPNEALDAWKAISNNSKKFIIIGRITLINLI